jgi:multidrug resistance efflux pump
MQSTNSKEIKAALWDQAFRGYTQVRCPMGGVVAIRKRKGQRVRTGTWVGSVVSS